MSDVVLNVKGVSHWFPTSDVAHPDAKKVLYNIDLEVLRGQFVSLVGPSGCGKSTLFTKILGTHPPCQGVVNIDGEEVTGPNRHVGIVYQKYSLYDFMTAEHNIAFGPMLDGTTIFERLFRPDIWWPQRKMHLEEAKRWLTKLGLEKAVGHYPSELSGGMQQRVAIAQALIMKPSILLLDEPFGALDEGTREELQTMLLHLYQENLEAKAKGEVPPHTVIMVTHELDEAFYIADRIIGLSQYWEREEDGHDQYSLKSKKHQWSGLKQGATIVYDKACPVFNPSESLHEYAHHFEDQKAELRDIVMSKKMVNPFEHRIFGK